MEQPKRPILQAGDKIIFNTSNPEDYYKLNGRPLAWRWTPKENEVFIVKNARVRLNRMTGELYLIVGAYSDKGPFTSAAIPASYIQWIFQYEGDKCIRRIFIASKSFNRRFFVCNPDIKGEYMQWENWENLIK